MSWYNSSWLKRKPIVLTGGASGAQSAYQVKLTVSFDSDMKSDFSDLRFTKADGTTLLGVWLESKTDNSSAIIWVKTDTPAYAVTGDIYMYYGNSGTVSNWDGDTTFLQYKETATTYLSPIVVPATDVAYEGRVKVTSTNHQINFGLSNTMWQTDDDGLLQSKSNGNLTYLHAEHNNSGTIVSEAPAFTVGAYVRLLITFEVGHLRGYVDGNEIASGLTTRLPTDNMGLLCSGTGSAATEWAFARKYVTNPATYAFGSEEASPGWTGKIIGVTSPAKVMGVAVADIVSVIGI